MDEPMYYKDNSNFHKANMSREYESQTQSNMIISKLEERLGKIEFSNEDKLNKLE